MDDPEQRLEHDADELEERIERLEGSIGESHEGLEAIAGDWDQTDDQAGGEDPVGAHEEADEPSDDRAHAAEGGGSGPENED